MRIMFTVIFSLICAFYNRLNKKKGQYMIYSYDYDIFLVLLTNLYLYISYDPRFYGVYNHDHIKFLDFLHRLRE